jgi:hypothetical protein
MAKIGPIRSMLEEYLEGREKSLEKISKNPHFLPLDTALLEVTLKDYINESEIDFLDFAIKIQEYALTKIRTHKPLSLIGNRFFTQSNIEITGSNISRYTPALVMVGASLKGILYASNDSYESARKDIFAPFLNKQLSIYLNDKAGTVFNVGHTSISYKGQVLGATPSTLQVDNLVNAVETLPKSIGEGSREINKNISNALDMLHSIQDNFTIHDTYGTQIKIKLTKEFKEALLSVSANIVVIQEGDENQNWGRGPEAKLIRDVQKVLKTIKFSRSLEEEVEFRIRNAFKGISSPNSRSTAELEVTKKPKELKVNSGNNSVPKPTLRNINTGRFTSLASLQVILNQALAEQIAKNMGKGTSRNILNYRSGRFADSAAVERMSQSKEGMITAFYSYMKYPYQTFEPGFAQGAPASRNPKLLISQSIREIGAIIVGNRMRAVLI